MFVKPEEVILVEIVQDSVPFDGLHHVVVNYGPQNRGYRCNSFSVNLNLIVNFDIIFALASVGFESE
jgi:hypothetical protein